VPHEIDDAAKVCAYCGADPRTGEKIIDAQAMLSEVFKPKQTTRTGTLLDYARQRQGAVVAAAVFVGSSSWPGCINTRCSRNDTAIANGSGVPMTEVTDVSDQGEDNKPCRCRRCSSSTTAARRRCGRTSSSRPCPRHHRHRNTHRHRDEAFDVGARRGRRLHRASGVAGAYMVSQKPVTSAQQLIQLHRYADAVAAAGADAFHRAEALKLLGGSRRRSPL